VDLRSEVPKATWVGVCLSSPCYYGEENQSGSGVEGNMAGEAVVSALIDKFISTVADKLFQEVSLIVNFREDFEFFCDQLIYIKSLLMDAGGKRNSTSVSQWLDRL